MNDIRKRRSGAAMVEFALVVSLLMILTMGTIQYGIILNKIISLSHVSREGGRYAAVRALKPNIDSDIKGYIIAVGHQKGLDIADGNISFDPAENTAANPARRRQYGPLVITITYNLDKHLFLPTTFLGMTIFNGTRTETTQMVME